MSNHVYWTLDLAVRDGKMEDLKALMKEMSDATKANEPGTLNYEWTLSEDGAKCTIYERYTDSAAALVHLASFGKNFAPRFMACLEPKRLVVHGNVTDEARKALSTMGAAFMKPFGGFTRS